MYLPKHFDHDDGAAARQLAAENPFALLMPGVGEPDAAHIPMLWEDRDDGAYLIGHVARANPMTAAIRGGAPAFAVFTGPHAYISPNWYATAGLVPTWNYAAVHVYGRFRVLDGTKAETVLRALIGAFESDATGNWSLDALTPSAVQTQLKGITAFEIPIDRVQTKFKMSQNRSAADVSGAIAGLRQQGDPDAVAVADIMEQVTDR